MATAAPPVVRERTTKPRLIFFTSSVSGQCRRTEGFLAQVLQRRRNHDTFRVLVVAERARLERPRGCRAIEELLSPWLK